MGRMVSLLKYHFSLYLKSNKIILPLVAWILILYMSYTVMPVDIVSSLTMSAMLLFFILVWVSFAYYDMEQPVAEQLVMLKVKNDMLYVGSKVLAVLLIGVGFSVIGVAVPLLQNILNGFQMYTRAVTAADIGSGFLFHIMMASLGAALGSVFHPRVIKDRKLGIFLLFLVAVTGILKSGLNKQIPVTRFITWLFPPVDNLGTMFAGQEYFNVQDAGIICGTVFVYMALLLCLHMIILRKNKF